MIDAYDYVTQMKSFLERQSKDEAKPSNSVSANLIMRFKQATVFSIFQSKQFLAQFDSAQQIYYVEMAEKYCGKEIYDPVEDDPAVRPLYQLACEDAWQEVEAWHQQMMAELEQRSPELAKLFHSKRGLTHRYWAKIKQLLWERYQIEWRSPAEMNPWASFD